MKKIGLVGGTGPESTLMYYKEYRNRLYNYHEILKIIEKYGLPQIWNSDFKHGPECYVEVQVWTDRGLEKWL